MANSVSTSQGHPTPLGSSRSTQGINFSLFSASAKAVSLALYLKGLDAPPCIIKLCPKTQKTASVWHVEVLGVGSEPLAYHYFVTSENDSSESLPLVDPYAKALTSPKLWSEEIKKSSASLYLPTSSFDWEGVASPGYKPEELVIYEAHVRGFTQDPTSNVESKGTFLGVIEKIPYLQALGINAIELLPIFEFDENENHLKNPLTGDRLYNFWGYSPLSFFAPMLRYSSGSTYTSAIEECKTMVRQLHKNGIEVILDVVFNHTGEGGSLGPIFSFKGIDKPTYYLLDEKGNFLNFSGTGNTFNCNNPVAAKLIVDALVYWVEEFHIDGFRFDLASILTRDCKGNPVDKPLILEMIHDHPSLKRTKLIAEAWDAAGLYQVGQFPKRWHEWNGRYRDIVRCFIKGDKGLCGPFATALCGSEDLFASKGPIASVNFITAHDGFTLHDLVSYNEKHNISNGENNQDGTNHNDSWNCGHEGYCDEPKITALRQRQMYNYILALTLSQGIPMILMGDEYGHSRSGNNNPYCHDDHTNWFQWDTLQQRHELFSFFKEMIALRKKYYHLLCRDRFLSERDIQWHGEKPLQPSWDRDSSLVAFTLLDQEGAQLFAAFNASNKTITLELPQPEEGSFWLERANTKDLKNIHSQTPLQQLPRLPPVIELIPFSALLAEKKKSS